jgi:hypothetical protein
VDFKIKPKNEGNEMLEIYQLIGFSGSVMCSPNQNTKPEQYGGRNVEWELHYHCPCEGAAAWAEG